MKFPRFEAHKLFSWLAVALILIIAASTVIPFSSPAGAWHAGFASRWLDPQEHDGTATPDNFFTALHDALIKNQGTQLYDHAALAERFTVAADSKSATFTLRKGTKFHNGDPVTTQDVKFSYENYRGSKADVFKQKTERVEIVDDRTVRAGWSGRLQAEAHRRRALQARAPRAGCEGRDGGIRRILPAGQREAADDDLGAGGGDPGRHARAR